MAIYAGIAMLDLGVSSALTREATKYNAGATSYSYYRKIKKNFGVFFYLFAIVIMFLLITNREILADSWFSSSTMPAHLLVNIVTVIGVGAVLRWLAIYYRGILIGYEDIIWISYLNTVGSTFRYLGVFPLFYLFNDNILPYFIYQALIIFIEIIVLYFRVKKLTVVKESADITDGNEQSFYLLVKFALLSGAASFLWMGAIAYDKLTISTIVSLKEYSYYTLAILMAGLINIINTPLKNIVSPRLTNYYCTDVNAHSDFFIKSTIYSTIAFGVIAISIAVFSKELIYIWTLDNISAQNAKPYLTMYALGNGLAVISSYVYYLQFSMGRLKMHLINIVSFFIIFIVSFQVLTIKFGAIGAGYSWLLANIIYFVSAYTIVVRKLLAQVWKPLFLRIIMTLITMLITSYVSSSYIDVHLYFNQLVTYIINSVFCFLLTLLSGTLINYKLILLSRKRQQTVNFE
jgi:O-antigen/teichoic acid export membrane protein